MPFKFENLQIWQKAFDLSDQIHSMALKFPKIELFTLTSQIKRAADSVVLNICEGSTGLSNAEFGRFLNIALRSVIEVVGCLMWQKEEIILLKTHSTIFMKNTITFAE